MADLFTGRLDRFFGDITVTTSRWLDVDQALTYGGKVVVGTHSDHRTEARLIVRRGVLRAHPWLNYPARPARPTPGDQQ